MKILLLFFFLLPQTLLALSWEEYLEEKKIIVSHERHLPYQLTHGYKTSKSVLLIHGIYSSPLYFRAMAEAYFKAGHNVVTVLLPGHWEKDFKAMDKITNEDWSREVDRGYEFARDLGDQVILSGHSLGGLLSIEQGLKRPSSEIHSVVVLSPSLKVRGSIEALCGVGVKLNLSGNPFLLTKPDGIQVPLFKPIAGKHIQSLSDRVLKKESEVPVFMAITPNDPVVDVSFLLSYFRNLPTKKKLIRYKVSSGIFHGDIYQKPGSKTFAFGTKANPDFDGLMKEAMKFIEEASY
jgi:pimeloyl-ACP methyl ester carboxylesterase